jgi:hypothetical protein
MKVFGCQAVVLVEDRTSKQQSKSQVGYFVGYDESCNGYKVYKPETKTVVTTRSVRFDEEKFMLSAAAKVIPTVYAVPVSGGVLPSAEANATAVLPMVDTKNPSVIEQPPMEKSMDGSVAMQMQGEAKINDEPSVRRSGRVTKRPDFLVHAAIDDEESDVAMVAMVDDPESYEEAMSRPDAAMWKQACDEEIASLKRYEVYKVVDKPERRKVITGKWVFRAKTDDKGAIVRYKARYVGRGCQQKEGIDYEETFSPTARMTTMRMMVQLAVQERHQLHQIDVKTAYLNSEMKEEVYVAAPEGYEEYGEDGSLRCWLLGKSLPGMKQSGRNWNGDLDSTLKEMNFVQSKVDYCFYTRAGGQEAILVWVDDMVLKAATIEQMEVIKNELKERYELDDRGELKWFLGINIEHGQNSVKMHQGTYIEKLLHAYGMADAKPKSRPMTAERVEGSAKLEGKEKVNYQKLVGSLLYVTNTRPDITYAVNYLTRYMAEPTEDLWNKAKHVLRYLKGTKADGVVYRAGDDELELFGYCDSDWGSDVDTRKSTTGYIYKLSPMSGGVTWRSKRQQTVAHSSAEAEYMALHAAAQEAMFLRQLLTDMGVQVVNPTLIFEDNQAAIKLTANPMFHQRTKHIDIKYHIIREYVDDMKIDIDYKPTEDMIADALTKVLPTPRFVRLKAELLGKDEHGAKRSG